MSAGWTTPFHPRASLVSTARPSVPSADTSSAHASPKSSIRSSGSVVPSAQQTSASDGASTRRPLSDAEPVIGSTRKALHGTFCADDTAICGTTSSTVSGAVMSYAANWSTVIVTVVSEVRSTLVCGIPRSGSPGAAGRTIAFQPSSSDWRDVKPRRSCADAPSPDASNWPTSRVHESPVRVTTIVYASSERRVVSLALPKSVPLIEHVPVFAEICSASSASPRGMPAKTSCPDATATAGRLTEIVSALSRSYAGNGGSSSVTDAPSTYEMSVYCSAWRTIAFHPESSLCADTNDASTACVSESAAPEPRWPTLGSHASSRSVTVSSEPPPCTSASELLPTSEFDRRPCPGVGRIVSGNGATTWRPETRASAGTVSTTVSGTVIE